MLQAKIGFCNDCADLSNLISQIDSKLLHYSKNYMSNICYLTNKDVNENNIKKLIRYKNILHKKLFNSSYLCSIDIEELISRVKLLLYK
jgi:adenine-specific DNA methylase